MEVKGEKLRGKRREGYSFVSKCLKRLMNLGMNPERGKERERYLFLNIVSTYLSN